MDASQEHTIGVAIVEDQRDIRDGLAVLIGAMDGFRCVGAFRTMEDAIPAIDTLRPQLALVDLGLPGMSGTEGIRILKQAHPEMLLLVLTVYQDDERIFDAVCAGATGYLLKKMTAGRLMDSLREAVGGGAPMSPEVARRVLELFRNPPSPEREDYSLTPHEVRLLRLFVDGHSYKTAAAELDVSRHTISFHLRNIYQKLQVHSKSEAVAKALKGGLLR